MLFTGSDGSVVYSRAAAMAGGEFYYNTPANSWLFDNDSAYFFNRTDRRRLSDTAAKNARCSKLRWPRCVHQHFQPIMAHVNMNATNLKYYDYVEEVGKPYFKKFKYSYPKVPSNYQQLYDAAFDLSNKMQSFASLRWKIRKLNGFNSNLRKEIAQAYQNARYSRGELRSKLFEKQSNYLGLDKLVTLNAKKKILASIAAATDQIFIESIVWYIESYHGISLNIHEEIRTLLQELAGSSFSYGNSIYSREPIECKCIILCKDKYDYCRAILSSSKAIKLHCTRNHTQYKLLFKEIDQLCKISATRTDILSLRNSFQPVSQDSDFSNWDSICHSFDRPGHWIAQMSEGTTALDFLNKSFPPRMMRHLAQIVGTNLESNLLLNYY